MPPSQPSIAPLQPNINPYTVNQFENHQANQMGYQPQQQVNPNFATNSAQQPFGFQQQYGQDQYSMPY